MSKLLTFSLLGLILTPFTQIYTMDQPGQHSWFSKNPVAVIAATIGSAALGYAGYILKKRYDKKEKLISKKEVVLGIGATLLAGSFFLKLHKNYHTYAPQLMVPNKVLNNNKPLPQSTALWKIFKLTNAEATGALSTPLQLFPAVFAPIEENLEQKGLFGSMILPVAATAVYDFAKTKYAEQYGQSVAHNNALYSPKKEDCKGFAALIGGVPDLMRQVMEVVQATPEEIAEYGVTLPKGILFYGPPGTGKTALARAFSEELLLKNIKSVFLSYSAPALKDKWIGGSAQNIKKIFQTARSYAENGNKVIVFIDEIDAIGSKRQENIYGTPNEVLEQLLTELDGIDKNINKNIIVIGATNRFQDLDTAVTRGGRLEYHIEIPLPSIETKQEILKNCLKQAGFDMSPRLEDEPNNKPVSVLGSEIVQEYINKDISGADIEALVRRAKMIAFSLKQALSQAHIEKAIQEKNRE